MIKTKPFLKYLESTHYAEKTIEAYSQAVNLYAKTFRNTDILSLKAWKGMLVESCKPATVNLRLRAINCYLEWIGQADRIRFVPVPRKLFLENVISEADYRFLCRKLKKDGDTFWYFVIRFFGATGARVSELLRFKAENVEMGWIDLYTKGGKMRRIYIPKKLRTEAAAWLSELGRASGYIFELNGRHLNTADIRGKFQTLSQRYGIDPKVMHPHSFRHRFAKSFIERFQDIALLADLMGHESIETTRIYLRRTAGEQQAIVDKIVTW